MSVAMIVLRDIGVSFLIFEISLILLRSGQVGRTGPGNSRHPDHLRLALKFFRFPAFISNVMILVGSLLGIPFCSIVGTVVFPLTFLVVWWIVIGMTTRLRGASEVGYKSALAIFASMPFLTVRVFDFLVSDHVPQNPGAGIEDTKFLAFGSLCMEVMVAILLLAARTIAEPLWTPLPETTLC
ncbi:hypothetical protein BDV18DRAFT_163255 [Aspergillus unguis]